MLEGLAPPAAPGRAPGRASGAGARAGADLGGVARRGDATVATENSWLPVPAASHTGLVPHHTLPAAPATADAGSAGSSPVAWKLNGERVLLLGWAPAILLQFAHPLVAAGVSSAVVAAELVAGSAAAAAGGCRVVAAPRSVVRTRIARAAMPTRSARGAAAMAVVVTGGLR